MNPPARLSGSLVVGSAPPSPASTNAMIRPMLEAWLADFARAATIIPIAVAVKVTTRVITTRDNGEWPNGALSSRLATPNRTTTCTQPISM